MLEAVRVASRVLNSCGMVLPSTLTPVQLCAEMEDGRMVQGESQISKAGGKIKQIRSEPVARATPEALQAIASADLIILGPGSLYTSIIPNLLVDGISEAILQAKARKLYVCNVMTQLGETIDYSVSDHLEALLLHARVAQPTANKLIQAAVINDQLPEHKTEPATTPVAFDSDRVRALGIAPLRKPLVNEAIGSHHDPERLAKEIMMWFFTKKSQRHLSEQKKTTDLYQRVASFFSI